MQLRRDDSEGTQADLRVSQRRDVLQQVRHHARHATVALKQVVASGGSLEEA